ncbi:MAG: ABC transporter permease [Planctomycetota bacterium]|jgi:ABC-2 type transport system permease protein
MSRVLAIASRELRSFFLTPSGYIISALFLFVTGAFFVFSAFEQGRLASMRPVLGVGAWLLTFIGPAVGMRMFSEEYRLGTIETLMTSPVRDLEAVLGKFLGGLAFLLIMLLPTAIYLVGLERYGRPDYGEVLCGYLGVALAGAAYLASGVLASTLTASQSVAFLLAVFFWLALGVGTKFVAQHADPAWSDAVFAADPDLRLRDFAIGLVDSSNIVYFLAVTVVCLVGAARSLEFRRLT